MSLLRVHCFSLSVDGYGAGPDQNLEYPIGVGGPELHKWILNTRTFHQLVGDGGGDSGPDDDFVARGFENIGAWIMGRNMFGPIRGDWPDENWRGWWGDNPPYHTDVFVLTHHARQPLKMDGDNTFYFVTGGIHEALTRAKASANGRDVRLGGGASTIRQYLQAKLVDQMHLAINPVVLGSGEHLFAGLDLRTLGYACSEHVATPKVTHIVLTKRG